MIRPCVKRTGCATCLGLVVVVATGCSGYGTISPTAYEYAKALYSVTNRQAADKLDAIDQQIDAADQRGELSAREAGWLHDIVADARQGRWVLANRACRSMMEDQVQ